MSNEWSDAERRDKADCMLLLQFVNGVDEMRYVLTTVCSVNVASLLVVVDVRNRFETKLASKLKSFSARAVTRASAVHLYHPIR